MGSPKKRLSSLGIIKWLWILIFATFTFGIAIGGAVYYYKVPFDFWNKWMPIPHGEMKVVVIKPGLSARQCANAFLEQGALTGSSSELAYWMARFGIDRKIRSGQYRVRRSGPWNMARQLLTVQPVNWSLTIIPGADIFSLRKIFERHSETVLSPLSGDDILKKAIIEDKNYPEPMRAHLPEGEEKRVAFLLPETYFLVEETPEELVRVAAHTWWDRYGARLSEDVAFNNINETAVVASMVQREALWDDERPIIAGVIANRLKKNMPLQIDATVVYAWKLKGKTLTRVLYSDLEINSPYNTYIKPGLPPAPICVPSKESWEAAMTPQETPYYYYVARKNGYHYFAESYDEHRRNIKKARTE
ncbi:aminodeoxychorismate lyase [Synergistales bacterium]|nr:aminodeoxychorismate lyase [Synergistales bacterium]